MKLPAGRIQAFLRDPGECRVVLLFGDDAGMIRDRAEALVRAVAGSLDDPFLVTELPREEIRRLPDEAAGLSLIGGRRVVRVRDVTDAATEPVQALLKSQAPALVVLEGPAIASRSKLRTALEAAADGVAIGCYPEEGRALEETIRETLRAQRRRASSPTRCRGCRSNSAPTGRPRERSWRSWRCMWGREIGSIWTRR